jgi:hypothetical protein
MKKSKYTDKKIIKDKKEDKDFRQVAEVSRELGITPLTS